MIDPQDGLPHIPAGKEGSREQEPLSEELALSANWTAATRAYSVLATATGHADAASEATAANQHSAELIRKRYWDEKQNYWITGYTRSGTALIDRQIGPVDILERGLFSDTQRDSILQQLASSDFETDWGTRGRSASSNSYEPNSYANGSVWAVSTASVATAFWSAHRPATAFPIWNALVPWSSLDSLGHMHETLAGDYYREEIESVPEQTWSSARFFASAVSGLLGLEVDGASNRVTFAPHLPANWNAITIRNLHVGASKINFKLKTSLAELQLEVHNDGVPTKMTFDPEIPLGAKLRSARWQDHKIAATVEAHAQDTHARMEVDVPHGDSVLTLGYIGGVEILPENPRVEIGKRSTGINITAMSLEGQTYTVAFDYVPSTAASLEIRTPWIIRNVQGASIEKAGKNFYRLNLTVASEDQSKSSYQHGEVKVTFGPER